MNKILQIITVTLFLAPAVFACENHQHRKLAEYYAPVVYQESKSAVLDFVTRFDYDGDWNGANNWRNAYLHELRAYVYYAVIESSRHYFITYAFYHPRDFTARPMEGFAPKTEHENDMEGCTLTIEKDQTPWGRPILLETLAHDHFYKYDNPHYRKVRRGAFPLDGSIVFLKEVDKDHHREPAIYIEPEGHGVKAGLEQVRDKDYQFPGIIYRFGGRGAELPKNEKDPDVSYDLISLQETLWAKRFDVSKNGVYCCSDFYSTPGGKTVALGSAFNGPIGGCAAKPPWGWDEASDGNIKKGDWFRDPLSAYPQQLRIQGFGGDYIHNPYLEIELPPPGKPAVTCSESSDSKDLKQSITSSLFGIGKVLFSGGVNSKQIGDKAKQLFLTDTVLLEWSRKGDFERWDWDKGPTAKSLPSLITENFIDQLRIPLLENFVFSSPKFNAPTRYFDSVVMKYRCSLDGARAKVYWTYDDMTGFDEEHSQSMELKRSEGWSVGRIDLLQSQQWDKSKSIAQIKVEIVSPANEKLATVDPSKPLEAPAASSSSSQFVINYIIFDRNSFSDTFER
jgi:hypothetical protein